MIEYLIQHSAVLTGIFVALIVGVGLYTYRKFDLSRLQMQTVRGGLHALRMWERDHSDFILAKEEQPHPQTRQWTKGASEAERQKNSSEDADPVDHIIHQEDHPLAHRWLRYFEARYEQHKAPDVDALMGTIEDELTQHDQEFRSFAGSLIILGLLGTFIGLLIVVIPIPDVIRDARLVGISDQAAPQHGVESSQTVIAFNRILDGLDKSVKGMPFAFLTSIVGLIGTLGFNGLFSRLHRKRIALLQEVEDFLNEDIAPKFAIIPPELRLGRAFTQVVDRLYNRYFYALSTYLNNTLSKVVEQTKALTDLFEEGARQFRESAQDNVESAQQLKDMMKTQFEAFDQRIEELGMGLSSTLDTLRRWDLTDLNYRPVFENIQNLLSAIRGAQEAFPRYQEKAVQDQGQIVQEAAAPVHKGLHDIQERIELLQKALTEAIGALGQGIAGMHAQLQPVQETRPTLSIQSALSSLDKHVLEQTQYLRAIMEQRRFVPSSVPGDSWFKRFLQFFKSAR